MTSSPPRFVRSVTLAMQDARFLGATIDTVFALKGLERIGDHAKNIAEQVLFVASGEDVTRHSRTSAPKHRYTPEQ